MKRLVWIGILFLLALTACDGTTREARRMVKRAEQLADTLPDSAARLIDSVLRMPVNFRERERMDMALLQAEALFGERGQEISPVMDDDFFDEHAYISTSPELERAAAYYAKKKQYAKAAHAALYSGFVQQHYDEKEAAMRSFKEAEQYGGLEGDSLTVARAEYWMGGMLYDEGREHEAMELFKAANKGFGNRSIDCAKAQNSMACCYMLVGENDSAAMCLDQSLACAYKGNSSIMRHKVMNNYAVLCQLQGKYERSIHFLKQLEVEPDSSRLPLLYLNLGDTYINYGKPDSAAFYYNQLEDLLPKAKVKDETKASVYNALSRFAKSQGNDSLALSYREKHETLQYEVMQLRNDQSVYRIQQQYDYESLRNAMNQKIILRHRIILVISMVAILGLIAFAISRIKLAQTRREEAKAKANLFHFMQQNKALVESNKEKDLKVLDATQQLSGLLYAKLMAMQKLDYCLKTPKDKIALKNLEKEVFGGGDHWEAVKEALEVLYPGLWETIGLKYPDMDEMERRVCMLSHLKLSRLDEATLLGISTSVLDKLRTKVRKTLVQDKTNS